MSGLTQRDRRALTLLAAAAALWSIVYFWPSAETEVVSAVQTVEQLEARVRRLRQAELSIAAREQALNKVAEALKAREKGLVQAETVAQAEAQVLQIIRRVLREQVPPVDLRGSELRPPKAYGEDYGEVSVVVTMDAGIEQVINLLADLGHQNEALSTTSVQFDTANPKQKTVPVRMAVSALVPKKLLPVKEDAR